MAPVPPRHLGHHDSASRPHHPAVDLPFRLGRVAVFRSDLGDDNRWTGQCQSHDGDLHV